MCVHQFWGDNILLHCGRRKGKGTSKQSRTKTIPRRRPPPPILNRSYKTPQIKLSVKERRKEVDKKLKNRLFRDYLEFGRIKSTKLDAVFGKRLAANRLIGSRFGVDGAVWSEHVNGAVFAVFCDGGQSAAELAPHVSALWAAAVNSEGVKLCLCLLFRRFERFTSEKALSRVILKFAKLYQINDADCFKQRPIFIVTNYKVQSSNIRKIHILKSCPMVLQSYGEVTPYKVQDSW